MEPHFPSLTYPDREHLLPAITVHTAAEDAAHSEFLCTLRAHGARLQGMPTYDPANTVALDFATDTVTYSYGFDNRLDTIVVPALDLCNVGALNTILFPTHQNPYNGVLYLVDANGNSVPLMDPHQWLRTLDTGRYISIEDVPLMDAAVHQTVEPLIELNP